MEKTNFETLEIYKLAEPLSDEIWKLVTGWGRLAQDTIGKQLVRSVDSIGANIAEGSGRGTPIDNRRFLRMARGSLYETRHWLRRAYRRNQLTQSQADALVSPIQELTPKLNSYLRRVGETIRESARGKSQGQRSKIEDQRPVTRL